MISILHLSDLHIVQNADWNLIRPAIIEQARLLHNRPRGGKLLVITGDFHNFWDEDYSESVKLIQELADAADIDISQDLFVVPGNHDVGNKATMGVCFPDDTSWDIVQERAIAELKKLPTGDAQYQRFLKLRMNAYEPYCRFLSELGIYRYEERRNRLPAAPHVRCWQDKLNILHLNTTLVYAPQKPGEPRDIQRVDLLAATGDVIWKNVNPDLPALALGHNSFFDLDKTHQTSLEAVFRRHGVCAYLCGDTHREERDRDRQMIRLESGYSGVIQIPNVVGVKGTADDSDTWSDFGLYWHDWDEGTGRVTLRLLSWKPMEDQFRFYPGTEDSYPMPRRDNAPADPDRHSTPDAALAAHLRDLMDRTRINHSSFKLMRPDELDRRLFPHIKEASPLPAMGITGEGQDACPVWDIIVRSWQAGRNRSVVLEGEGGIGKTVALLSPTGDEALSVPALYIQLFELVSGDERTMVEDYLKQRLGRYWEQLDELARQNWEKKPSLLLLLDGVNELPAAHRFHVIHSINDWAKDRPGVQLVAVSRPLDGIDLRQELCNDPIALTMSPMDEETVKSYLTELKREIPSETDPIWKALVLPLFLVLYAKTDKLVGRTAYTYPLAPKKATNGCALIWNYLQRELLRKDDENWVLQCAVACEYLLPAVGYYMVTNNRDTIERTELDRLLSDQVSRLSGPLPCHLTALFEVYDTLYDAFPTFDEVNLLSLLLSEIGLLIRYKGQRNTYIFLHQSFRNFFAGMYLVNAAEAEPGLPELWRHSQPPLAMDCAAQLMEDGTAEAMWQSLRGLWPTDRNLLYVQLELHRRRTEGLSRLDFTGMDLRGISLARYGNALLQNHTIIEGALVDESVFQGVGHSGSVCCLSALPDGRVISGSDDKTLRVWDSYTGDCLRILGGHIDSVRCVTALPNGCIVSGSNDCSLRVWDSYTGDCLRVLEGHTFGVNCVAALRDGRIVSGGDDRTLRVWDSHTGDCLWVLEGHTDAVNCVAALHDGRIVSGSDDHTLRLWDLTTGESRALEGHRGAVNCVAALPDGRIVSGSDDHTLRLWDLTTGDCLWVVEEHSDRVNCVEALPDGRIVSGSNDRTLRVWNLTSGDIWVLKEHTRVVECVAALPDGRIVSGSTDHTLLLQSIDTDDLIHVGYITKSDVFGGEISQSSKQYDLEALRNDVNKLLSDYYETLSYNNVSYDHFLNYIQSQKRPEINRYLADEMPFLFALNTDDNSLMPAHYDDIDLQELIYQMYLLDANLLQLNTEDYQESPKNTDKKQQKTGSESKSSEQIDNDENKDKPAVKLEKATKMVLEDFEKWLKQNKESSNIDCSIALHPYRQRSGTQYGYDVGMTMKVLGSNYNLRFECKCITENEKKEESVLNVRNYSYNLLQFFMHSNLDVNNRWILVCPYGDLQNDFPEKLFDNWNKQHDHIKLFGITESTSNPTCKDFLGANPEAYRMVYDEDPNTTQSREEVFDWLYSTVIGNDYAMGSVIRKLHQLKVDPDYIKQKGRFPLLSIPAQGGNDALQLILDSIGKIHFPLGRNEPEQYGVYIVGHYGIGKTWMLYRTMDVMVTRPDKYQFVPVFLKLKGIMNSSNQGPDIERANFQQIAQKYIDDNLSVQDIEKENQGSRLIVFLDGFDEVLSGLSKTDNKIDLLWNVIREVRNRCPSTLFVVTSRETDYEACKKHKSFGQLMAKFDVVELEDCSSQQVRAVLQKYAKQKENNNRMQDAERLRKLAQNDSFVNIMRRAVFFGYLINVDEYKDFRLDEGEKVDEVHILSMIIQMETGKLDKTGKLDNRRRDEIEEQLCDDALKLTTSNVTELPYSYTQEQCVSFDEETIGQHIPLGIMSIRPEETASGQVVFYRFRHNIIREFLVVKKIANLLEECVEGGSDQIQFFNLFQTVDMTVVMQKMFISLLKQNSSYGDAARNKLISWLETPDVKKEQSLSTKLLELLLLPNSELSGKNGKLLDLSRIKAHNLYLWKCTLKNIDLSYATIEGLHLIDAVLDNIDFRHATLKNLQVCSEDAVSGITHWSDRASDGGEEWHVALSLASGTMIEYTVSGQFDREHVRARMSHIEPSLAKGIFNVKNKMYFLGDGKLCDESGGEQYRLDNHDLLQYVIPSNNANWFIIERDDSPTAVCFHRGIMEACSFQNTERGAYCVLDIGEIAYLVNNQIIIRNNGTETILDVDSQYRCMTAKKMQDGSICFYLLTNSALDKKMIKPDGALVPGTKHLPIRSDDDYRTDSESAFNAQFQTVHYISDTVLAATDDSALYFLKINKDNCSSVLLSGGVQCRNLMLGNSLDGTRLEDKDAYELLKSMTS